MRDDVDAGGGERAAVHSAPRTPVGVDVRAAPLYSIVSARPWRAAGRRVASAVALAVADLCGLAIGLYLALIVRALVYGKALYWSMLWDEAVSVWMRFLGPIMILVFLQAGLYRRREARPGAGRILAGLVMVALIVLAFGLGTGYEFTTTGLIPTAVVTCTVAIGLIRAAYDSLSLELMRAVGVRRRVVLVGEGESVRRIHRQLLASRSGIPYELVGVVSRTREDALPVPTWTMAELAGALDRLRPDELILTEADFDEMALLSAIDTAQAARVTVKLAPSTTEILVHDGEYVPGQGVPLFELRPPVLAGVDFVLKRTFDLVVAALGCLLL
ncbi:MAG: hypothetical protein FJW96_07155, partial [Actinobacteria bacterium]|nr:hypothetical protein [Actinomycetota bacterium]